MEIHKEATRTIMRIVGRNRSNSREEILLFALQKPEEVFVPPVHPMQVRYPLSWPRWLHMNLMGRPFFPFFPVFPAPMEFGDGL